MAWNMLHVFCAKIQIMCVLRNNIYRTVFFSGSDENENGLCQNDDLIEESFRRCDKLSGECDRNADDKNSLHTHGDLTFQK